MNNTIHIARTALNVPARTFRLAAAALAAQLLVCSTVSAANWSGQAGGDFALGSNWDNGISPTNATGEYLQISGEGMSAVIAADATLSLDGSNSVEVSNGGALTLGANSTVSSVTNNGSDLSFRINGGGRVSLGAGTAILGIGKLDTHEALLELGDGARITSNRALEFCLDMEVRIGVGASIEAAGSGFVGDGQLTPTFHFDAGGVLRNTPFLSADQGWGYAIYDPATARITLDLQNFVKGDYTLFGSSEEASFYCGENWNLGLETYTLGELFELTGVDPDLIATLTINGGSLVVTLSSASVPEPATWAALAGAVLLAFAAVRRWRR